MRPGDQLMKPTRIIERLHVRHGAVVRLRFRITNTVGSPTVISTLRPATLTGRSCSTPLSTRGKTYDIAWVLDAGTLGDSRGTAAIEADFRTPGRATQRYQRLYPFVSESGTVRVLTPGRGRYLLQIRKPTWLNQDVDPTLSELP